MNHPNRRRVKVAAAALMLSILAGVSGEMGGCGGHKAPGVTGDSTVDLANKDLQANQRAKALQALWHESETDPDRLKAAREASKNTLWKSSAPEVLRKKALELLLTDTSPEGMADTRKF